jgi:hypothetical protein
MSDKLTMLTLKRLNPKIISNIPNPPFVYGIDGITSLYDNNGEGSKICIIGTGVPTHSDFKNIVNMEIFDESAKNPDDKFGYSTMIGGIISANKKTSLIGFAPRASLYFVKAFSDYGIATQQSLISSVLWSMIKDVDLIIVCGEKGLISQSLSESMKKASAAGTSILMSSGKYDEKKKVKMYDSCGIFCISHETTTKNKIEFKKKDETFVVTVPKGNYYTTYAEDKYAKPNPTVYSLGVVGGLLSLIIADNKRKNNKFTSKSLYRQMFSLIGN